jgi:hypothetical protein
MELLGKSTATRPSVRLQCTNGLGISRTDNFWKMTCKSEGQKQPIRPEPMFKGSSKKTIYKQLMKSLKPMRSYTL